MCNLSRRVDYHARYNRGMRFRKLRIAWSVGWDLVVVLLCVLWVRNYWWVDWLPVPISEKQAIGWGTTPGVFFVVINPRPPWIRGSNSADEWLSLGGYNHSRIWGYFGVQDSPIAVIIPCWFCLLLVASIAAFPWLQHLSWRFSLRTLLTATTILAVILGLIVYATNH